MAMRFPQHLRIQHVDVADEAGDEPVAGKTVQFRRFVHLFHPSLVQYRNAMRQGQRLVLRMGHEHESDADILLQVDQLDLHLLAQLGIQRTERFIQQQQARAVDQGAPERHALLLAARQFARIMLRLVGQMHQLQRFPGESFDFVRRAVRHLEREGDVLRHRHVREQGVALEHGMNRTPLRRCGCEILAIQENLSAVGQVETCDQAQQCSLATAGGAEQGKEFPGLDAEVDVIYSSKFAEAASHVPEFQQNHCNPFQLCAILSGSGLAK